MTYSHLNRRLHLYLGLALLPWFFMYGISSVPFAHSQYFDRLDAATGLPLWTLRAERIVDVPVPEDTAGLKAFGRTLLTEAGVDSSSFGTYRQSPSQINVYSLLVLEIDAARSTTSIRRSSPSRTGAFAGTIS